MLGVTCKVFKPSTRKCVVRFVAFSPAFSGIKDNYEFSGQNH